MKHKHAELIKAWADGAEIEQRNYDDYGGYFDWFFTTSPNWNNQDSEFRIKPEPKPDVVRYGCISSPNVEEINLTSCPCDFDNLKFTWDGETEKLKSAEVIK